MVAETLNVAVYGAVSLTGIIILHQDFEQHAILYEYGAGRHTVYVWRCTRKWHTYTACPPVLELVEEQYCIMRNTASFTGIFLRYLPVSVSHVEA